MPQHFSKTTQTMFQSMQSKQQLTQCSIPCKARMPWDTPSRCRIWVSSLNHTSTDTLPGRKSPSKYVTGQAGLGGPGSDINNSSKPTSAQARSIPQPQPRSIPMQLTGSRRAGEPGFQKVLSEQPTGFITGTTIDRHGLFPDSNRYRRRNAGEQGGGHPVRWLF